MASGEGPQYGSTNRFEFRKRQQLKTARVPKHYGQKHTFGADRYVNEDERQERQASVVLEFLKPKTSNEEIEAEDSNATQICPQYKSGTVPRRMSAARSGLLEQIRTKSRDLTDVVLGAARSAWAGVGGSASEETSEDDGKDGEGISVGEGKLGKPRSQERRRKSVDFAPMHNASAQSRTDDEDSESSQYKCVKPNTQDRARRRRSFADGLRQDVALSKDVGIHAFRGPSVAPEKPPRRRHTISDCCSGAEINRTRVLSNAACKESLNGQMRSTLYSHNGPATSGTSSSRPTTARPDRSFPSRPTSALSRTKPAPSKPGTLSGGAFSSPKPPHQTLRPSSAISRPQTARLLGPAPESRPGSEPGNGPPTGKSLRPGSAMSNKNNQGTPSIPTEDEDTVATATAPKVLMKIEKQGATGSKTLVTRVREIDLKRVWDRYMDMKPNQDGHVSTRTVERMCGMLQSGDNELQFRRTAFSRFGNESSGTNGAFDAQARAGTVLKKRSSFLERANTKGVFNFKDLLAMVYPDATVKQINDMEDLCLTKFSSRRQKKFYHQHDEKHKKAVRSMYCTIKGIPDDEESFEETASGVSLQELEDFLCDHHPDVCTIELLRTLGKGQRDRVYKGYTLQKKEFVEWVLQTDQFWGTKGGSYVYIRKS